MFSSELKKGSTEMLVLSLLEAQPRHGYEIGKLIESRSGGTTDVCPSLALPDAPPAREPRLDQGPLGREGRSTRTLLLSSDARGPSRARRAAGDVEGVRRRGQRHHGDQRCVTGTRSCARSSGCRASRRSGRRASCASWRRSSRTSIARPSRRRERGRRRCPRLPADPRLGADGAGRLARRPPPRQAEIRTNDRTEARAPHQRTAGTAPPDSRRTTRVCQHPARYALRTPSTRQDAGLHGRGRPHAGARHRRQQRHLQRRQRRPPATAGVPEPGRPRARARAPAEVRTLLGRAGDVPRLAAAEHRLRAPRRVQPVGRNARRLDRRGTRRRAGSCPGTCSTCFR